MDGNWQIQTPSDFFPEKSTLDSVGSDHQVNRPSFSQRSNCRVLWRGPRKEQAFPRFAHLFELTNTGGSQSHSFSLLQSTIMEERRSRRRAAQDESKQSPCMNLVAALDPLLRRLSEFRCDASQGHRSPPFTCTKQTTVFLQRRMVSSPQSGLGQKRAPMRGSRLLETRWLYLAPGGLPHGREGYDYVVGEDAVVAYVNRLDEEAGSDDSRRSPVLSAPPSTSANDASISDFATSEDDHPNPDRAPTTTTAIPATAVAQAVTTQPASPQPATTPPVPPLAVSMDA